MSKLLRGLAAGLGGSEKNRETVITSLRLTCQSHLAPISRVYKYLLSNSDFNLYNFWDIHPNSIGKHAQVKYFPNGSAKHARLTTVKRLNLLIKSQTFQIGRLSCVGVALNFNSLGRNGVTTFPWLCCFNLEACWLT